MAFVGKEYPKKQALLPMPEVVVEQLWLTRGLPNETRQDTALPLLEIVSRSKLNRADRNRFRTVFEDLYGYFSNLSKTQMKIGCLVQRFDEEDIKEDEEAQKEAEKAIKETKEFMASESANEEKSAETAPENNQVDHFLEVTLRSLRYIMYHAISLPSKENSKTILGIVDTVLAGSLKDNPEVIGLCEELRQKHSSPITTETVSGEKTGVIGKKPSSSDKIFFPTNSETGAGTAETESEADKTIYKNRNRGRKGPDNKDEGFGDDFPG